MNYFTKTTKYDVKKGITIPSKGLGLMQDLKYPFNKMLVGDSFFFDKKEKSKVSSAAAMYCKKQEGKKFTVRLYDVKQELYGCWRIS